MDKKPTYEELEQRVRELEASESDHKSAYEALQESEKRYRNLFEHMIDEVHLWKLIRDEHGAIKTWRLVDVNPAGLRAWGKTRSETIGKTTDEIFSYNATAHFIHIVRKIFAEGKPHIWESHFPATGQTLRMASIPFGEYFISTGSDITERKLAMEMIIQAKNKAEAASHAKSRFLANMSHEIRTPMNAILSFAKILKDPSIGSLNQSQADYLAYIVEGGNRLLYLIDDVLDLSRVETGNLEISTSVFDLEKSINEVTQALKGISGKKGLAISTHIASEVPLKIIGDEVRFGQVLKKLISNAIKFTEKGRIEITAQKRSNDELMFQVKDTGIGIPNDKLKNLYEKFYQVDDSYTKKYQGTGLGLALSKALVNMMGGRVWCESEVGKGSSFFFTIKFLLPSFPIVVSE